MRRLAVVICLLCTACGSGVAPHGDGDPADRPAADGSDAAGPDTPADGVRADSPDGSTVDASTEVVSDVAGETSADAPTDAPIDASGDAPSDTPGDVSSDGTSADGGTRPYVYLAMASTALLPNAVYPTDIVMVDVAAGRAVLDTTLIGTIAMAYQDGKLLVVRGGGYTRVSILNADTLAVERTQLLPWDPTAAVFSSDARYLYAAHDDGHVAQVRMADGTVTADVLVPRLAQFEVSLPNGIYDVAISPSQKLLATTTFHGGAPNSVGLVTIEGETLSLSHQWVPQPFDNNNCTRQSQSAAFDDTNRWLVTFDGNCGAFDIYDVVSGDLAPGGSVLVNRTDAAPNFAPIAKDPLGRLWVFGYMAIDWIDPSSPGQHGSFPFGTFAGLMMNDPARTLYAWQENPRRDGVFTIDPTTGTATRLPWNLDLLSEQALLFEAIWVER